VTNCHIGIGFAPGQDGRTINDEIAGTHESSVQGLLHEEHFMRWGSCRMAVFALVRGTGNAEPSVAIRGEATGESQSRPVCQPVMHLLGGEPPQGVHQGDREERFVAVGA
jgi:hypothetical protein